MKMLIEFIILSDDARFEITDDFVICHHTHSKLEITIMSRCRNVILQLHKK